MRLSKKITQYFTLVVFCSMAFGFFIFYFAVERATTQSAIGKLEKLSNVVEKKIAEGVPIELIEDEHPDITIKILGDSQKELTKKVIKEDVYEWDAKLQTMVNHITVTTYPYVKNSHYQIQAQIGLIIIDNKFFIGIVMVIAWIFIFVIISIIFFGELIARNLYTPFYHLLNEMEHFDVRENQELKTAKTEIRELNQLNEFFIRTSKQSIGHYNALKEFSQNLSHELQTPIANIKAKIELMLNDDISEFQMTSLSEMYDSLNRISAINRSLILLMSLEDHQNSEDVINFTELIENVISEQEDLILMNDVKVTLDLSQDIYININPLLAHIVISNLVSNANRHNYKNGSIYIGLTSSRFIIRNTGYEQEFTNETIFKRFNKGKHNTQSIGLGLALVKKILNVYDLEIKYTFSSNLHQFTIRF